MLLLDSHNLLIQTILTEKFASASSPTSVDQVITDFDNVQFHLSNPFGSDDRPVKSVIHLSMAIKCYQDLVKCGAKDVLEREYKGMIIDVEQGYDFTIEINMDNLPQSQGIIPKKLLTYAEEREALVKKCSLMKRNALAAPFEGAFAAHTALSKSAPQSLEGSHAQPAQANTDVAAIHYREEEAIYISPQADRVTVIFSTVFREEVDHIFGEVFLREFVDARKRPALQNAPQVLFSNRDPPLEIRGMPEIAKTRNAAKGDIGYITFGCALVCHANAVLFPRHFNTPDRMYDTISQIQLFRDYFHYHIKCSKAYMHSRMRQRVSEYMKVLNRAKLEEQTKETDRRTSTGRYMARRG
jgi:actin related protein 2/3 complex, subunit 2